MQTQNLLSSVKTASNPLSCGPSLTHIRLPSTASSYSATNSESASPLSPEEIMDQYTKINEKYSKFNTAPTTSADAMDCSNDFNFNNQNNP